MHQIFILLQEEELEHTIIQLDLDIPQMVVLEEDFKVLVVKLFHIHHLLVVEVLKVLLVHQVIEVELVHMA